jgi:peroxiredoxin Q/BCP
MKGIFPMLEPGTPAPNFKLPDQNGKEHVLEKFRGQWIVLYFYPKDMTPGCTTEACTFRDEFPRFKSANALVFGISKDSVQRHAKFAEKYQLPFTLLSDESGDTCAKYDVWKEKSLYGKKYMGIVRSTYIIDPQGNIAKVYPKVKVKEHASEVLSDLDDLS